jgi:uncharacterized protein (DUF342 family)
LQSARGEIEVHPGEHAFAPRDQGVAPAILARHPAFWQHRTLKIEDRIQQRKANLMQQVQHRLNENREVSRDKDDEQNPEMKNRRDSVKKRIEQRRPRERRNP